MNKIFKFFLSSYENSSMEIQKKSKALLIGNFIILFGCFAAIPTLFIQGITAGAVSGSIVFVISAGALIASIVLLKKNKYILASYLVTTLSVFTITFAMYFTEKNVWEFNKLTVSFFIGLTLTGLVSSHKKQAVIYYLTSLISMIVFFIAKVKFEGWQLDALGIQEFVQGVFFLTIGSLFVIMTISIIDERIKMVDKEVEKSKDRYEQIKKLISDSKNSINIGENLVNSSEKTVDEIMKINLHLVDIQGEVALLNTEIDSAYNANNEISESTKNVNKIIDDYNAIVTESSAAIEEMAASINNITIISNSKKDVIDRLVVTANEGENEMNNAIESINSISREAEDILEIIDVITNISNQTDLLAMNAAIEAAHAGEYGKGFAVVADEIRKLAEGTNENIAIITGTLKKNSENIQNAIIINKKASEYFHRINNEIVEVNKSIDEIILGMQELSGGSEEIMMGVSNIITTSRTISDSNKNVEKMIDSSNSIINKISTKSENILNKLDTIRSGFKLIIEESQSVNIVGKQNIEHIQNCGVRVNEMKNAEDNI